MNVTSSSAAPACVPSGFDLLDLHLTHGAVLERVGAERLKRRRQVVKGVIDGSSPSTRSAGAEAPGPDLRVGLRKAAHDGGELILVRDLSQRNPAHADWVAAANS